MQDICVTATRDHNVYASFHPSIATKDAETRSKMNSDIAMWIATLYIFPCISFISIAPLHNLSCQF